ncbi:MAG: hypothetical protein JF586_16545 [Burkholderiales bacterium]|nr:hypothetical protein [Burkholderiales bacterium]
MDTTPGTVTIWQSGRLAPQVMAPRFDFTRITREQWLGAALLFVSGVVMAVYVAVLQRDVSAAEMEHMAQRSRAVAEARCEADQPAERRGLCLALFNGDVVALRAASPVAADERDAAATGMAVSFAGR